MNPEHLDSVNKEKKQAILVNAIGHCMVDNCMTLEILDNAYREIQEWYRKGALMPQYKKADDKPAQH